MDIQTKSNYKISLALFIAFNIISSFFFTISFGKPAATLNKKEVTPVTPRAPTSTPTPHNYCIAIRGNGELMPAHWGALAQTVENFGVPKGMAGGSSGSISTFLMESFLMNPLLKDESLQQQNTKLTSEELMRTKAAYLAFMIKSLQGFVSFHTEQPKYQHFFQAIKTLMNVDGKNEDLTTRLSQFVQKNKNPLVAYDTFTHIKELMVEAKNSKIFFGPQVERFYNALLNLPPDQTSLLQLVPESEPNTKEDPLVIIFKTEYAKLKEGLSVFGSFNAKDDKTLFYRGGIVNFKALANVFGFIANFYSLNNASATSFTPFRTLLEDCAEQTSGLSWNEIIEKSSSTSAATTTIISHSSSSPSSISSSLSSSPSLCKGKLHTAIKAYINDREKHPVASKSLRLDNNVGDYFHALISTSVVVDDTNNASTTTKSVVERLLAEQKAYNEKNYSELNDEAYRLGLENPPIKSNNLKFGYWGHPNDLNLTQEFMNAKENEELWGPLIKTKKERFLSLGTATWREVLSLSPAEPGLSSMLHFKNNGKDYISFGGWSDLLPVPVLKFMGCEKVVYVTRQGGESLFAQGIAKRLLNLKEIEWKDLDPSSTNLNNMTSYYNNTGRTLNIFPELYPTQWSKMFNLAHPESNFNLSLKAADAIICTHWNDFDVKKQYKDMIEEAYNAPIYNPSHLDFLGLKPTVKNKLITTADNTLAPNIIRQFKIPQYSGCIPLN